MFRPPRGRGRGPPRAGHLSRRPTQTTRHPVGERLSEHRTRGAVHAWTKDTVRCRRLVECPSACDILACKSEIGLIAVDSRKLKETEVKVLKGFRDFILRGNVMDLAVAVIIGAAFTAIVTALTENIIKPLLGATIGKPDYGYLVAYVNGGKIMYGNFITAIINFLILAAVVYFFLVLPTQYLLKKFNP